MRALAILVTVATFANIVAATVNYVVAERLSRRRADLDAAAAELEHLRAVNAVLGRLRAGEPVTRAVSPPNTPTPPRLN